MEEEQKKPTEIVESKEASEATNADAPQQTKDSNVDYIQEGYAKIQKSYLEISPEGKTLQSEVFYNPVQVFNRDLTVLVIRMFTEYLKEKKKDKFEDITILDALSASGLRTIRFSKELKNIKKVYANDISEASHKLMMDNFKLNNLDLSKVEMTLKDAVQLLYEQKFRNSQGDRSARFDVIDIDPYGTAAPFLDSAISSASGETLLCITSTDSRILCGPDTQKCFYLYGSSRAKISAYQENAVRIILYSINQTANRYGKCITPLISYLSEFYVRVFLIVKNGKQECSRSFVKTGNIFYCDVCQNQYTCPFGKLTKNASQQGERYVPSQIELPGGNCDQCGEPFTLNGPIWLDKLNDSEFVQKTIDYMKSKEFDLPLATNKKILGILHSMQQEHLQELDGKALGYHFEHLSKMMKVTVPGKRKIYAAFKSLGYTIEQSYLNPAIFKTNAPSKIVFDIVRNWKRTLQPDPVEFVRNFPEGTHGYKIITQPQICQPNWDLEVQLDDSIARWLPNPEKNWGPGKRAAIKQVVDEKEPDQAEEGEETKKKLKAD